MHTSCVHLFPNPKLLFRVRHPYKFCAFNVNWALSQTVIFSSFGGFSDKSSKSSNIGPHQIVKQELLLGKAKNLVSLEFVGSK